MKKADIYTIKGLTDNDDETIFEAYDKGIEMTIDEQGRVWSGGVYIADAVIVGPGEGIGCIL